VAGVLGTLFIGLVSINSFNHSATKGLLNGGGVALLEHQLIAVIAVIAYAFIATFLLAHLIKRTIGLRVTPDDESRGLDLSQHMETAYDMTSYGEGARFSSGTFKS
jgi:Amt family ammonium transporter